ncbi:MAG: hypothetical protein JRM86_03135 [Nitrososphaerota archaeon]|nr:hypothetical protein [Nitrososphaerota archaeon]
MVVPFVEVLLLTLQVLRLSAMEVAEVLGDNEVLHLPSHLPSAVLEIACPGALSFIPGHVGRDLLGLRDLQPRVEAELAHGA